MPCISVCVYVHLYICVCVGVCVGVCVCVCVWVYVYVWVLSPEGDKADMQLLDNHAQILEYQQTFSLSKFIN